MVEMSLEQIQEAAEALNRGCLVPRIQQLTVLIANLAARMQGIEGCVNKNTIGRMLSEEPQRDPDDPQQESDDIHCCDQSQNQEYNLYKDRLNKFDQGKAAEDHTVFKTRTFTVEYRSTQELDDEALLGIFFDTYQNAGGVDYVRIVFDREKG
jgi:hypothetical protein